MLGQFEKQLIVDDFKQVLDKWGLESCVVVLVKGNQVFQFTGHGANQTESVFVKSLGDGLNQMLCSASGIGNVKKEIFRG